MMHIGIVADHGGFELKSQLTGALMAAGYEVDDFGAHELITEDDYPDFVVPLAIAVAREEITQGIATCGSGVGACGADHGLLIRSSGSGGRQYECDVSGRPGHRICSILGLGSAVPERPFRGD